jgi:molybdopterin-guanine dinucleotide biosynthesis protein A
MGRPKAWLPFGGERLLQRVVRLIAEEVQPIVVVAATGQKLPGLPPGVTLVCDAVAGRGPLQGLAAGLAALPGSVELAYATSTDVPFLAPRWVTRLAELIGPNDLAIPHVDGHYHPLAALYRPAVVLPAIKALLAADRLRPFFLTESVPTRVVTVEELRATDPDLGTLRNLNTPADYTDALLSAGLDPAADPPEVTFELFGVPRLRAGVAEVQVRAATLGDALNALADIIPALAGSVILRGTLHPAYRISLDGEQFLNDSSVPLAGGDRLLLLAADAGG